MSEKLSTKVTIENVDYKFFNTFKFEDLYVEDLNKDTLLYVDKAYANFIFWRFFKGKFVFNSITLDGFKGNLLTDSAGVSNLDFIIQAFKKPKKDKKPSPIEFNLKDIQLKNSAFKLYNFQRTALQDTNRFDGNRIDVRDINAKISVDYFKGDSLNATIKELSAREKSGLIIQKLSTTMHGFKTGFRFPYLSLQLPNSLLELDSVRMEYDSIADMNSILNAVRWNAKIKPSSIVLKDLAAFVPGFSQMRAPVKIKGNLTGRISSFRVRDFEMQSRNAFLVKADVDMNGLPDIDETFVYANIKDFRINKGETQDLISKLTMQPFVLPKELTRLGTVKYSGNITGFFSNLVAYGNIQTDVGSLKTDILLQFSNHMKDLHYNGTVQTTNFNFGKLLGNNTLGKTVFKINTQGTKLHNRSLQGTITGNIPEIFINNYTYQDITLDGNYDGTGFEGLMEIDDPNLTADFNGLMDWTQELPIMNFDLLVENADINALNLTEKYEGSQLSFRGNMNMLGNSLDNLNGYLLLDSIHFINNGNELAVNILLFESEVGEKTRFSITSDLINGYFDGDFKYSTISQSITSILQNYLPSLSGSNVVKKGDLQHDNIVNIDLTLRNTKLLSKVLELPFVLDGTTTIKGYINDSNEKLKIETETPLLSLGQRKFERLKLTLDNGNNHFNVLANGNLKLKKDNVELDFLASAANDSLYTQFVWHNNDSVINAGEIQAYTKFFKENNLTAGLVNFLPTQIVLSDSVWDMRASQIEIKPDTTFDIHKFKVQCNDQYILIDGILSKKQEDMLLVEMSQVDVGFILDLLAFDAITVDGKASGAATVRSALKQPILESNLFVKNTHLNDALLGDAYIYSGWSQNDNELLFSGTFIENNDIVALANGAYSLATDSLNFLFDANHLNIGFLQKWLGGIVQNVNGRGTGSVRMFGPANKIGFEGDVYAENTSLSIDFLKTTYTFTDTIHLTRNSVKLNNISVYDKEGNRGLLNGLITHDGSFNGFNYDIRVNAKNILGLNTKSTDNDFFYGKAYATGDVHIYGVDNQGYIDINAKSEPNTKFYVSVGGAAVAKENDFITFVNPNDTVVLDVEEIAPKFVNDTRMNISMSLDVTPDAEIQLILDPQAGDMISATGNGNLRLLLHGDDDFRMYGGYTIDKGNYLFTLENIFRKQFKIDRGSTINWSGDPLGADLNIRAIHTVTASLRDLMSENIRRTTDRSIVPVDAILHITEDLTSPNIRFDVDLPSSDETLKMQVKNLINTEEMMNRQMVYLLLFGKFYTPEYNRNAGDFAESTLGNVSLLASSAAFGQFSNYLSQLVSNLSLGVNVRSTNYGGEYTQEYETAFNYQPNNRLIVNGNFGYRDDNFAKNKIIGDLDIEYILTDNSKWRLKAFNHTVDKYSLRAAPFIQGVGIMYKEDFNSWTELWRRYLALFKTKEKLDSLQPDTIPKSENLILNDTISTQ